MNRADTIRAIQGILSRARERQGFTTKTKLVKFLYLLDLETFRESGQTLTGFDWRFHLYGPWSADFETLFAELAEAGAIRVQRGQRPDLDTQFLMSDESMDLDRAVSNSAVAARLRHYVDSWSDRSTGELLDFVYFSTAPMHGARPGESLDFSSVKEEQPPQFFLESAPDPKALAAARRAIEASIRRQPAPVVERIQGTYDESYRRIDAALADEDAI